MLRFQTEKQAADSGFIVLHEPEASRFALYLVTDPEANADTDANSKRELVGEAHYSLRERSIDFDHTVVSPKFRGTGLSGILAQRAVTGEVTTGRRIEASCWFIANYLRRHA